MAELGRRTPASDVSREQKDELEELEDEAIIAQENVAHLPQKRASIANEARSVVISQRPGAGSTPYGAEHSEATVVVRERRGLNAVRRRIFARRRGSGRSGSLVWAGIAVAAFAAGGLLAFLSMRGPEAPSLDPAPPKSASERPKVPRNPASNAAGEPIPRQVRLEELPLERAKSR